MKVQDAEEQTLGGVLLPGSVQQRPTSGSVVSVGDGAMPSGKPLEFTVSTGDEVSTTRPSRSKMGVHETLLPRRKLKERERDGICAGPIQQIWVCIHRA